jgi:hypothetical protein
MLPKHDDCIDDVNLDFFYTKYSYRDVPVARLYSIDTLQKFLKTV